MRRQVLGAAAVGAVGAVALAGCGLFDDDPEPVPEPDALQPLLDEALALAAAYERGALAQPGLAKRLTPIGEAHREHAAELAKLIGATLPSASASAPAPSGTTPAGTALATLRKTETTGQKNAAAACRAAPAERAALVGSIAAARAAHVEALR